MKGTDPVKSKCVLIVDDDPDVHAVLKKRLQYHGYQCVSSYTVDAALMNLKRLRPDLVILDLGFPDDDGIEFLMCAQIYLPANCKVPPVIVLSSHDENEVVRRALKMGALGFISKPYDPEKLLSMIEDSIGESSRSSEECAPRQPAHP